MKIILLIVISFFACHVQTQTKREPVPTGVWGGKGFELTVTANGGVIDYGCDSGTVDHQLQTDTGGRFSGRGTHLFGRGGPRQPGAPSPKPRAANYEGVRKGNELEITVTLPDLNRKIGTFRVQLGQRSTLERCG